MTSNLITVAVTTAADGSASARLSPPPGRLTQYRYVPDGTNPLDTGADITLTGAKSGFAYVAQVNIGVAAFEKLPRRATSGSDGAANVYAVAGTGIPDTMSVCEELLFAVAQGGNVKSGTFYFWFE